MRQRLVTAIATLALLSACGGDDGSSPAVGGTAMTPTPTQTSAGCTLRDRQDWVAAQLREWYLFPETLPTSLDPTPYATVSAYLDALTATARSQRRDRFFTYLTSIAQEDAYYDSGSSAGLGVRLAADTVGRRIIVAEAFEGTPALAAGIDRGTEIIAIGTTTANLRTVDSIIAAEGTAGVTNALGPDTAGTTRLLRVASGGATRDVSVAKASFSLTPVSSRYGARIIDDGGRQVGYVNLRTFISTADPALRAAFARFRAAGVTDIIIDLRYNGGGLVSIAELLGDLLGRDRATSEVFDYTTFRPEKSAENGMKLFSPQPESVAPTRLAFIGTGGTASASELVINAFVPYLHARAGLIGTNTFGKPVGQIALDRAACDDRLRVIAFATQNAARQGNYFDGLAGTVEASCQASDDVTHQLGDPLETSTARALDFLAGRSCPSIATSQRTQSLRSVETPPSATTRSVLLTPDQPTTPQREVPGLF